MIAIGNRGPGTYSIKAVVSLLCLGPCVITESVILRLGVPRAVVEGCGLDVSLFWYILSRYDINPKGAHVIMVLVLIVHLRHHYSTGLLDG